MATKHTEHYQLNLWEPEDKFVRTEFNENFGKIDAALAAHDTRMTNLQNALNVKSCHTLIRTNTLYSTASEFVVDMSGIDWSQWDEVTVLLTLSGSGASYIRPNNLTSCRCQDMGSSSSGSGMIGTANPRTSTQHYQIKLFVLKKPDRLFESVFWGRGRFTCGYDDSLKYSALTTLNLGKTASGSAPTFDAGCKAEIYGMR